jgi:hypothetical protein
MPCNAAATIEIERSLTADQYPIPSPRNFRDRLAGLPSAICVERHGEMGRFIFPINDRSIIASTAALADNNDMIVIESDDGWLAVEPEQRIWNRVPGAHYRWSANICRSEDEFGGADVFWIDYERVTDSRHINNLQGDDGWYVTTKTVNNKISVTFTHETVKTVDHKNA